MAFVAILVTKHLNHFSEDMKAFPESGEEGVVRYHAQRHQSQTSVVFEALLVRLYRDVRSLAFHRAVEVHANAVPLVRDQLIGIK